MEMKVGSQVLAFGTRTYIMGILNVTPDSFSDGGQFLDPDKACDHAIEMISQGADLIDLGGESSRPGHTKITAREEMDRILPVIGRIRERSQVILSVDTIRAEVAEAALKAGANIINDIWGLQGDPEMVRVAAAWNAPVIVMHNQTGTEYKGDLVEEMKTFFQRSLQLAEQAGLGSERIILDPGIGFGKTAAQNIAVMSRLAEFRVFGLPLLLAASRKSFLGKILDLDPEQRMEGTLATTVLGIAQGVDLVRVHDIKENIRAARVTDAILRGRAINGLHFTE